MKSTKVTLARLRRMQALTPVLVVGVLMLTGAVVYNFNAHAAVPGFTFSSSASSYQVGQTITVSVYENSDSQCANVVEADFTYPANLLEVNAASMSISGSKFESSAPNSTAGNGSVTFDQFTTRKECGSGATATSGVSGNQLIGAISFKVIAPGTATLSFKSSSTAISSTDNKTNVAPGGNSKTYALAAVPVQTPPPAPTPSPSPTPNPNPTPNPSPQPAPRPTPAPAPRRAPTPSPSPVTSITPSGTDTSIPVTNQDTVQVTTPVDVNPLPIQPDGINRIEYYLSGKLVATVKTAPYTYHLDTASLLNGKYVLTTKTFYANGQSKSVSQTVLVKNKFGLTQFGLWFKKYGIVLVLLLLVAVAGIIAFIVHKRKGSDGDYFDDGTYDTAPSPTVMPESPIANDPTSRSDWQPLPIASNPVPAEPTASDPSQNLIRPTEPPQS